MFNYLPDEIIQKIIFYSHNTLSKKLQYDIKNFQFHTDNFLDDSRFCIFCRRYHRYPRHIDVSNLK